MHNIIVNIEMRYSIKALYSSKSRRQFEFLTSCRRIDDDDVDAKKKELCDRNNHRLIKLLKSILDCVKAHLTVTFT